MRSPPCLFCNCPCGEGPAPQRCSCCTTTPPQAQVPEVKAEDEEALLEEALQIGFGAQ